MIYLDFLFLNIEIYESSGRLIFNHSFSRKLKLRGLIRNNLTRKTLIVRLQLTVGHCVNRSPDDAGNQCCYGHDGQLRFAADTFQGSTPDRSHDWGAAPYVKPGLVPSLSHWLQDVVTFYYCCLWTDYQDCDYYMDQRGTRDCSGYSPPKQGMAVINRRFNLKKKSFKLFLVFMNYVKLESARCN